MLVFLKNKKSLTINCKIVKPNKYAFSDNIQKLVIGKKVKVISTTSFLCCRNLSELDICGGLEIIDEKAFFNCSSLKKISLPRSLKVLGECAFADCNKLEEIILPSTLESLSKGVFKNCTSIKRIVLPESLKVIGAECFSGCTNLEEVVFSGNLIRIEDKAFNRCDNLKTINLPETLEYLGSNVFSACHSLEYIELNSKLKYLGKKPFPAHICNRLQVEGKAYCSSFLTEADVGTCPTVNIADDVNELLLGFNGMLPYADISKNKTCFNHILSLNQDTAKVFIGEHYYSYNDETDFIIKNGEFDFLKYDAQFSKSSDFEKPFVSVFRLVYNQHLSEEKQREYQKSLIGNERAVAVFSAERNEPEILSYILKNSDLDSSFYTELYNTAISNGNKNLLDIISLHSKNTGITETENLFGFLLV